MKLGDKVAYVTDAPQTRDHHCHWPGCDKQVPPAMWGCSKHWFTLPVGLRRRVWAAFEPGQEETGSPSDKYLEVAREVQDWIKVNYPSRPTIPAPGSEGEKENDA